MTKKSMQRNGFLLAAFAIVATFLVLAVEALTADRIKSQQRAQTLRSLNEIIPADRHDNDLYQSCGLVRNPALGSEQPMPVYRAFDDQKPTALAAEIIAPNGYSGPIRLLLAIRPDGEILGVRTLQHQETPGLGDKIELQKSDWILSFAGKQVRSADDERWTVQRDGGMFDQFTGATITPRAVVQAVKTAALYLEENSTTLFNSDLANCQEASNE
ncbi:electron transport complex subunit RsxG [Idiomarina seosinensis]|uniref:electron transport complex subunit RsxG n=1 Tax=Idiomarina seosinensis TaxID=281739 RepID=UPI00384A94E1